MSIPAGSRESSQGESMRDASEVRLEATSEKDLLEQIKDAAALLGWKVYHTFDSRRSDPGFPDLVLANGTWVIFLEVKSAKGRMSSFQRDWQDKLKDADMGGAFVVRPQDWERVIELLQLGPRARAPGGRPGPGPGLVA